MFSQRVNRTEASQAGDRIGGLDRGTGSGDWINTALGGYTDNRPKGLIQDDGSRRLECLMRKGEKTKKRIIEQTAPLFNQRGVSGSSLADIMAATGLQKGGIYNHFESKDELALLSFDYAAQRITDRLNQRLTDTHTNVERLETIATVFCDHVLNPPVPGGCPLLNAAVESDDTHPVLRERVRRAMDRWRERIRTVVRDGMAAGEFRKDLDADVIATRFIATLEGGVMLSKLYGDPLHIERAVSFLTEYVHRELCV
jgi:TetR/AcrR family transcriptional regulator, transcriptional repressor for nem operon